MQGLRRAGHHARARAGAHHLAGRQHFEDRDRRRHADASVPFRRDGAGQATPPSQQGYSVARWESGPAAPQGGFGLGLGPRQGIRSRSLEVVTTHLVPGYLRKNGVPYSAGTQVTEYYDRFTEPNGDERFMVMTIVTDPQYLAVPFVTTTDFKKEPDGSKWDPTPCTAR